MISQTQMLLDHANKTSTKSDIQKPDLQKLDTQKPNIQKLEIQNQTYKNRTYKTRHTKLDIQKRAKSLTTSYLLARCHAFWLA